MKELNRNTLLEAIRNLPIHTVPESVWKKIVPHLPETTSLKKHLPKYAAPEAAWDQIESTLDQTQSRSMRSWLVAAAATILMLMSISLSGDYHTEIALEISNKEVKDLPMSTRSELGAFDEELQQEEMKMYECFKYQPKEQLTQLRPTISAYMTAAHHYDSLRANLPGGDSLSLGENFILAEQNRDSLFNLIMAHCQ